MIKNLIKLVVIVIATISTLPAYAKLSTPQISGVSGQTTDATGNIILYGGLAYVAEASGSYGCSGSSTCNTCVGAVTAAPNATLAPCNTNAVLKTTQIVITTNTDATAGTNAVLCNGTTIIGSAFPASGQTYTLTTTWNDLCKTFLNGSDCDASGNLGQVKSATMTLMEGSTCTGTAAFTFTIYISDQITSVGTNSGNSYITYCKDAGATLDGGVCYAQAQEGDEKIYVTNFSKDGSYPVITGAIKWQNLVAVVTARSTSTGESESGALARLSNVTGNLKSMGVDQSTGEISPAYFKGLTNEQEYCFTFGNQDATGNIYKFIRPASLDTTEACKVPSQVVGILSDKKCFIATAAYGSSMDAHVNTLREFRNKFLFSSSFGKQLVKLYYTYSPEFAVKIGRNDHLKALVRLALWPVVWIADASVATGMNLFFAILILGVGTIIFPLFRRRKSKDIIIASILVAIVFLIGTKASAQTTTYAMPVPDSSTPPPPAQTKTTTTTTTTSTPAAEGTTTPTPGVVDIELPPGTSGASASGGTPKTTDEWTVAKPENTIPKAKKRSPKDIYDKAALQKRGLYKVDKDGAFYYKANAHAKHEQTVTVRLGQITAPNITAETNSGRQYSFEDIYPQKNIIMLNVDYEWQPFQSFGKLGVVGGVGFFTTNGNGQYATTTGANGQVRTYLPLEKYYFYAIPISLGVVYKLDFMRRQWFVPYVSGGGMYYGLIERRDDNKITAVGAPAGYGAAGGMLNITALNRELAHAMDSEYGVSNLWLTGEFRHIQGGGTIDMTTNFISLGVGVDY